MCRLTRKLADITNDNDENNSSCRPKRQRVRHKSPLASAETDDEDMHTNPTNRADEQFACQAGHKFFLLCAPWIRSGDNLFDLDIDEDYDAVDRFTDDKNKAQGQLKEIIQLLQGKFLVQSLRQKWFRRQVSNVSALRSGSSNRNGTENRTGL